MSHELCILLRSSPLASPTGARDALLRQIKDKAVVHGKVTLSSGQEADFYIDLRRVTLDGEAAPLAGQVMLDLTADLDFDAVGGLTLGADPVASAMLHAAAARGRRLDAFVVRKSGKAHGLQRRIEGPDISGRRVLVVEDTSTTGNSPLTAVEAVREAGGGGRRGGHDRRARCRRCDGGRGSAVPARLRAGGPRTGLIRRTGRRACGVDLTAPAVPRETASPRPRALVRW